MNQTAIVGGLIVVALVFCAIVAGSTAHLIAKRRRRQEIDAQEPKPEARGGRRRQEN